MIQTIARETIVEMLLNSLEAERYVRGPLLLNVVDELSTSEEFAPATEMAKRMLAELEDGRMADREFAHALDELRACVRRLSRRGLTEPQTEALARAAARDREIELAHGSRASAA